MDVFNKTCKKRSKRAQMNFTIEFYIFEIV